jgi:hypothetical protein
MVRGERSLAAGDSEERRNDSSDLTARLFECFPRLRNISRKMVSMHVVLKGDQLRGEGLPIHGHGVELERHRQVAIQND